VNTVWEFNKEGVSAIKPNSESEQDKREVYIKKKYVEKLYVKPIEQGNKSLMFKILKYY